MTNSAQTSSGQAALDRPGAGVRQDNDLLGGAPLARERLALSFLIRVRWLSIGIQTVLLLVAVAFSLRAPYIPCAVVIVVLAHAFALRIQGVGTAVGGSPVDAPEGAMARPRAPESKMTSASTVGFPRLSRTSRPMTYSIALTTLPQQLMAPRLPLGAARRGNAQARCSKAMMAARCCPAANRSAASRSAPQDTAI